MARARSPARDKAYELYKQSKGERLLKDIATEVEVSDVQIRKWKNIDKWDEQMNGNVPKSKSNVPIEKKTQKESNSRSKRVNRSGNPNPKNQFAKRNTASVKHGFFAKHLPEETLAIMDSMNDTSPADLIWGQIQIQYAAIIRAQKIMFVEGQSDMTKELKREKHSSGETGSSWEEEYEIQFAWDKHATFLNAQSRAMSELRGLIKQFNDFAYEDDERKLKLQQMQIGIEKTKAEMDKISNGDEGPIEIIISSKKSK